jgi:DNA (cytosine-5)-methyltransferase 1
MVTKLIRPWKPTSIEICAGAGGAALGMEQAGFRHVALVENDKDACNTLRANRPLWNVVESNVEQFSYDGTVDLLSGGVPCQPFSVGGVGLGPEDERDLFPEALRLVREIHPRAVLLENVPGLARPEFKDYRKSILNELNDLGYHWCWWDIAKASDFGVPQFRPRFILVALRDQWWQHFRWPKPTSLGPTVGYSLYELMSAEGWEGAHDWAISADTVAPTLSGAAKTGGGPDLGQSRTKSAWSKLHVDPRGIADGAPRHDGLQPRGKGRTIKCADGNYPMLTVRMAARLQGFPDEWIITGKKTSAYRQVSHAFPPPVSRAFGEAILRALTA